MQTLEFKSIIENPQLVSPSILKLAQSLPDSQQPRVAEIDPKYMGGKKLCEEYGLDLSKSVNCVIVEAVKTDLSEFVAIVIPVGYRADLNGFIRRHLNVRRVSLAPLEKVIEVTGMEYGSITPFGLPFSWKILIDKQITTKEKIVIGGGKQISKLIIPTSTLINLSNTEIIENLSSPITS